jgi:hypothetical protein
MEILANIIGITGTALLISSYFLLQKGKLKSDDWSYLWMNLIAAIMISYSLFWFWNWASVLIEIFWIGITVYGMLRKLGNKTGQ